MWSFHFFSPQENSFFWVRDSQFFSLFSFCHIYPTSGLSTSPTRKWFQSPLLNSEWHVVGHLFSQHPFIISVCWPLPKCWGHSCEWDMAQASGSSAFKEDRPPGASGWKWAEVCTADQSARYEFGSRANHPSWTPGLETGECARKTAQSKWNRFMTIELGWRWRFGPESETKISIPTIYPWLKWKTTGAFWSFGLICPILYEATEKRHHWILWMGWAGDLKWSSTNWAGGNLQRACWLEGVDVRETKAFCEQGSQGIDYTVLKCGPQGSRLSPISPVSLWEQGGKENRLFWEGKCIT